MPHVVLVRQRNVRRRRLRKEAREVRGGAFAGNILADDEIHVDALLPAD